MWRTSGAPSLQGTAVPRDGMLAAARQVVLSQDCIVPHTPTRWSEAAASAWRWCLCEQ